MERVGLKLRLKLIVNYFKNIGFYPKPAGENDGSAKPVSAKGDARRVEFSR